MTWLFPAGTRDGQTHLRARDSFLLGVWVEKLQGMQLWGKFQLLGETRSVPNQKLEAEIPGAVWGQDGMKQKNQKCGFLKF